MKNTKFVLLIGSAARKETTRRSDVDIVEIGEPFDWVPPVEMKIDAERISKVKYTNKRFRQLHKQGSLFLLHIFNEGKLLVGDPKSWRDLRGKFHVKKKFSREIARSRAVLNFLISDEENAAAPIAFLSNSLRALKQMAIYRLAEAGIYVFDKRKAILKFHTWIPKDILEAMLEAEFIISRGGNDHDKKINFTPAAERLLHLCIKNKERLA